MWTSTLHLSLWDGYYPRTREPVQAWPMSSSPTQAAFLYKAKKNINLFQSSFIFLHNRMASFIKKIDLFAIKSSAKQNIQSEMYEGKKIRVEFLKQNANYAEPGFVLLFSF